MQSETRIDTHVKINTSIAGNVTKYNNLQCMRACYSCQYPITIHCAAASAQCNNCSAYRKCFNDSVPPVLQEFMPKIHLNVKLTIFGIYKMCGLLTLSVTLQLYWFCYSANELYLHTYCVWAADNLKNALF